MTVLRNAQQAPLAVYVHWPWCKAKCPYCDFNSHAGKVQEEDYIRGLLSELSEWHGVRSVGASESDLYSPATRRIESIFFGGGTPSLISARNIGQVIDGCRTVGAFQPHTEITVECNPTSFDYDRKAADFFKDLKAVGVNRVSIGIQGLRQEWLDFLGRTHRAEDAFRTLDAAQNVFGNVNADVIYGLPQQELSDWLVLLETLSQRQLAHISAYQLTIEPNTRFYMDVKRGLWEPVSGEVEADFFQATREHLVGAGYENYEISNFAKPGMACRHNTHVWRYGEYLGIGAGAHGRVWTSDGIHATQVVRQPEGYLKRLLTGADLLSRAERLSTAECVQEAFFSGLRLAEGIDSERLRKTFGDDAYRAAIDTAESVFLVDNGLLHREGGRLRLSDAGWPLLNSVLNRLLRPLSDDHTSTAAEESRTENGYNQRVSVLIE